MEKQITFSAKEQRRGITYLKKRNIIELFEGLTTQLISDRPDNHVQFLREYIGRGTPEHASSGTSGTSGTASGSDRKAELPFPYRRRSSAVKFPSLATGSHANRVRNRDHPTADRIALPAVSAGGCTWKAGKAVTPDVAMQTTAAGPVSGVTHGCQGAKRGPTGDERGTADGEKVTQEAAAGELSSDAHANESNSDVVAPHVADEPKYDAPFSNADIERNDGRELDSERQKQVHRVLNVISGTADDLPELPTNMVRVFVSSTFSDFRAERNQLPIQAYPELRRFCTQRGLDFQVVDMRWGVTDEVITDHQVSELCLQEIRNCQQVSCGPNFVCFLGSRYGWQPFPTQIESSEFEIILKIAMEENLEGKGLIDEWFKCDENNIPPVYLLQPIVQILAHYNDPPGKLRNLHRSRWQKISDHLQHCLREGAHVALTKGLISADREKKYFVSVTEEEIQEGCLKLNKNQANSSCISIWRNLRGVELNPGKDGKRYVDLMEGQELNRLTLSMQKKLIFDKLPSVLQDENRVQVDVDWQGVGLESTDKQAYTEYLKDFCQKFVEKMEFLIDRFLYKKTEAKIKSEAWLNEIYYEVIQHLKFAKKKTDVFCGRKNDLAAIRSYVCGDSRSPMILFAASGLGKTALLAKVAMEAPTWAGPGKTISIIRFLGTTTSSTLIIDVFHSIIKQLCLILHLRWPIPSKVERIGGARRELADLLFLAEEKLPKTRIIILLDSVDQLESQGGAHQMVWLPLVLPKNVKFIISMLPDRYSCLKNLEERFPQKENYHELKSLSQTTGEEIVSTYLLQHSRSLTKEQHGIVMSAFENCRKPLFLRLLLNQALSWTSYSDITTVATSVSSAISTLFEELEKKFGGVFVTHALGYMTCSLVGLSNNEMDDVLSLDDEVLAEVYQYHDPPVKGLIRIPPLMWARLAHALQAYLTEKRCDSKTVITWYHRQFIEAAKFRYLSDPKMLQRLHSTLTEMYENTEGVRRSVVLTLRDGKVWEDADRGLTHQPLTASNPRKLHCLPYHLLHSQSAMSDLYSSCLFNFQFLLEKLKSFGVAEVEAEYNSMYNLLGNKTIGLFVDFFALAFDTLRNEPLLLAHQLLVRLVPDASLESMIQDAKIWLETSEESIILPRHDVIMETVDTSLKICLLAGSDGLLSPSERYLVCNWQDSTNNRTKVFVFNWKMKDTVAQIKVPRAPYFCITQDERHLVVADIVPKNILRLYQLDTGDEIKNIEFESRLYEKATTRDIAVCGNKFVALAVRYGKPNDQRLNRTEWKMETYVYVVDLEHWTIVGSYRHEGRKHLERLIWVDETRLVTISRDLVNVIRSSDVSCVQSARINGLHGKSSQLVGDVLFSCFVGASAKVVLHSTIDLSVVDKSEILMENPPSALEPFGLKVVGSLVYAGVYYLHDKVFRSGLCRWNRAQSLHTRHRLNGNVMGEILEISRDGNLAFIGCRDGFIEIVNISDDGEFQTRNRFNAHAKGVSFIRHLNFDLNRLMTIGQDNQYKVWDVDRLCAQSTLRQSGRTNHRIDLCHVLDFAVHGNFVVTVDGLTNNPPIVWSLQTGLRLAKETLLFKSTFKQIDLNFLKDFVKTHAEIRMVDDLAILERRTRSVILLVAWKVDVRLESVELFRQFCFDDAFFTFHVNPDQSSVDYHRMYLTKDKSVAVYDMRTIDLEFEIEDVPSVRKEFTNIQSATAKKKLKFIKTSVTADSRYYILANPFPFQGAKRFVDLVDLKERKYLRRVTLPLFAWKVLDDGFYRLFVYGCDVRILLPKIRTRNVPAKAYQNLLISSTFVSPDGQYGVDLNSIPTCICVYQFHPQYKRLFRLSGHHREITDVAFNKDCSLLVSASNDCSLRVWSLSSGQQLTLYQTTGPVHKIHFVGNVIAAKCFSSDMKSVVILEIKRLERLLKSKAEFREEAQSEITGNNEECDSDLLALDVSATRKRTGDGEVESVINGKKSFLDDVNDDVDGPDSKLNAD